MRCLLKNIRFLALAAAVAISGVRLAEAAPWVIAEGTGPFVPSFRGQADTTYFGWSSGTWDGNIDDPFDPADTLNGVPSINPGALPGTLLVQNNVVDIISSSNNIYTDPSNIDFTLTIPTAGPGNGTGFTTIIVQGNGLNGAMMGLNPPDHMAVLAFGAIEGIQPTYVAGLSGAMKAQWWAKWEIPNSLLSTFTVSVFGYDPIGDMSVSVTDLVIDTYWSSTGFAADTAVVPEPASASLIGLGALGLLAWRRRSVSRG